MIHTYFNLCFLGENSMRYDFYLILEYCDCDLNSIITSQTLRLTQEHIKSIMYQTLVGNQRNKNLFLIIFYIYLYRSCFSS